MPAADTMKIIEPSRPSWRWTIRGGVSLVFVLMALLALYLHHVQRQSAVVDELRQRGTYITYEPVDDEGNRPLHERPVWMRNLLENDWLGSPSGVNTHDCFSKTDDRTVELIANLPRVKGVDLTRARISSEAINLLSSLHNLRHLELAATCVNDDDLRKLHKLDRITHLGLAHTSVSDAGIDDLTQFPYLKRVDLRYTLVSEHGIARLRAAFPSATIAWEGSPTHDHWQACAEIVRNGGDVRTGNGLGDPSRSGIFVSIFDEANPKYDRHRWIGDADVLSALPKIQGLWGLFVNPDHLGPEKWALIAECPDLNTLDFKGGHVTDEELYHLSEISGLTDISIRNSPICDAGLMHIVTITRLTGLGLSGTSVSDQGVAALEDLKCLKRLDLSQTAVTDAALPCIAKLSNLESLNLGRTNVTDAGLLDLHGLSQLKFIGLSNSPGVSQAGVDRLRAAIPGIQVGGYLPVFK